MGDFNGDYREYKLSNGLHVALMNRPTKTINGLLRVDYGSLHEQEEEKGLAHFLEHTLMNAGTKKYTPLQIAKIREKLETHNAHTNHHKTEFSVDSLAEDLELYLDFVSEITFNPRFDTKKIKEEKQRILREISDKKSSPDFKDNTEYRNALYRNHPVTKIGMGDEVFIQKATTKDLKKFWSIGYNASNMKLFIAGKLPDDTDVLINKYFGDKPKGQSTLYQFPEPLPLEKKVELYKVAPELLNADYPQESSCDVRIGIIAPSETSDEFSATSILSSILGSSQKSRLFNSISRKKGLAYRIYTRYDGTKNAGDITINGSFSSPKKEEAIDNIFEEMKKLRAEKISQEEIDSIKRTVRYQISKVFESNEKCVDAMQTKIYLGVTPEEIIADFEKVTLKQVIEAAQKYLPESREKGKYVLLVRDPLLK